MDIEIKNFLSYRMVKSEDLNHHKTLFAGRCAEWIVESGFIAAASVLEPHHIVCLKIYGLEFLTPVHCGDILCFKSRIVFTGRSSMIVYISTVFESNENDANSKVVNDGFIKFIYVDDNTNAIPHNINVIAKTEEDKKLMEIAKALPR